MVMEPVWINNLTTHGKTRHILDGVVSSLGGYNNLLV